MKNKFIIIAVVVLLLGAISYLYTKSNSGEAKEITKEQVVDKEEINGSGLYLFDIAMSKIEWEGRKTFAENWVDTGNINVKSGDITIDGNNIVGGNIIIDMNTISVSETGMGAGNDKLVGHLKSPDFFDVTKFATSEFKLTSITKTDGEYNYQIKGDITIKGITKQIEFPAVIYSNNGNITLVAKVTIDRSQFDVKYGSVTFFEDVGDKAVDNNFVLNLNLIAKK